MMPRNSHPSHYSSSDRRSEDRKKDPRASYKYYEDEDDSGDDRGKSRRHLGRSRHPDGEDRIERSQSRSRSRSPKRNEINIKGDDSRISAGIQMKLAVPAANPLPTASKSSLVNSSQPSKPSSSKLKVASIFNEDDDDEPEEMPPECRMRMKNVGRETPTSAGPNSFGKTKIGFCNVSHIAEKKNNK